MSLAPRIGWLALLALLPKGSGAEPPQAGVETADVVARVDDEVITAADVDREIAHAFPGRTVDSRAEPALRERTLEQLVRRQLVLRYLRDIRQAPGQADIDLAVERWKQRWAQREESFDRFLQTRKLDEPGLRKALTWQIGWSRYLARYLGDENLQHYFDKHRRDFDGTQLHVAHILLPVEPLADEAAWLAARKRAAEILAKLRDPRNPLTFSAAARQFSAGPSREAGGDLGPISRHGSMPEPFSQAAFALEVNQISDPVETVFGIHIVHCVAVIAGQKQWSDVRPELERALSEYVFHWAAEQARPKARVEIVTAGR